MDKFLLVALVGSITSSLFQMSAPSNKWTATDYFSKQLHTESKRQSLHPHEAMTIYQTTSIETSAWPPPNWHLGEVHISLKNADVVNTYMFHCPCTSYFFLHTKCHALLYVFIANSVFFFNYFHVTYHENAMLKSYEMVWPLSYDAIFSYSEFSHEEQYKNTQNSVHMVIHFLMLFQTILVLLFHTRILTQVSLITSWHHHAVENMTFKNLTSQMIRYGIFVTCFLVIA